MTKHSKKHVNNNNNNISPQPQQQQPQQQQQQQQRPQSVQQQVDFLSQNNTNANNNQPITSNQPFNATPSNYSQIIFPGAIQPSSLNTNRLDAMKFISKVMAQSIVEFGLNRTQIVMKIARF